MMAVEPETIASQAPLIPSRWILEENEAEIRIAWPSTSNPGTEHKILYLKLEGTYHCDCMGFFRWGHCKHILALREAVGELKRPRTSKKARDDSYHTFTEDELSEQESIVYKLLKVKGPLTDRQINKELGWNAINRVNGRRNKLVEKGMVIESGEQWDEETKRTVTLWKVKT